MSNLKWLMVYALVGYAAVLALLYVTQRAMQYFPERFRTAPAAAGLPQAALMSISWRAAPISTPCGRRA